MDMSLVPSERIEQRIFVIRGRKVMLDADLAELYGVPTKVLKQAVKRNSERFPEDFMFILTVYEARNLRSQIVTLGEDSTHFRWRPMAFTEQGVAMLSSVLKSERAILVNIQIIRVFTRMREMIQGYKDLLEKVEAMEKTYDEQFVTVFEALRHLLSEPDSSQDEIGFKS